MTRKLSFLPRFRHFDNSAWKALTCSSSFNSLECSIKTAIHTLLLIEIAPAGPCVAGWAVPEQTLVTGPKVPLFSGISILGCQVSDSIHRTTFQKRSRKEKSRKEKYLGRRNFNSRWRPLPWLSVRRAATLAGVPGTGILLGRASCG